MSKWLMRGHFRYLRFKTFPMTPRTPQCKVFWALLSSFKHSGVPKDSKSPTLEVLGFTPTLGQSGVATKMSTSKCIVFWGCFFELVIKNNIDVISIVKLATPPFSHKNGCKLENCNCPYYRVCHGDGQK